MRAQLAVYDWTSFSQRVSSLPASPLPPTVFPPDTWELYPKTDYTYAYSGSYYVKHLGDSFVSPNMARRTWHQNQGNTPSPRHGPLYPRGEGRINVSHDSGLVRNLNQVMDEDSPSNSLRWMQQQQQEREWQQQRHTSHQTQDTQHAHRRHRQARDNTPIGYDSPDNSDVVPGKKTALPPSVTRSGVKYGMLKLLGMSPRGSSDLSHRSTSVTAVQEDVERRTMYRQLDRQADGTLFPDQTLPHLYEGLEQPDEESEQTVSQMEDQTEENSNIITTIMTSLFFFFVWIVTTPFRLFSSNNRQVIIGTNDVDFMSQTDKQPVQKLITTTTTTFTSTARPLDEDDLARAGESKVTSENSRSWFGWLPFTQAASSIKAPSGGASETLSGTETSSAQMSNDLLQEASLESQTGQSSTEDVVSDEQRVGGNSKKITTTTTYTSSSTARELEFEKDASASHTSRTWREWIPLLGNASSLSQQPGESSKGTKKDVQITSSGTDGKEDEAMTTKSVNTEENQSWFVPWGRSGHSRQSKGEIDAGSTATTANTEESRSHEEKSRSSWFFPWWRSEHVRQLESEEDAGSTITTTVDTEESRSHGDKSHSSWFVPWRRSDNSREDAGLTITTTVDAEESRSHGEKSHSSWFVPWRRSDNLREEEGEEGSDTAGESRLLEEKSSSFWFAPWVMFGHSRQSEGAGSTMTTTVNTEESQLHGEKSHTSWGNSRHSKQSEGEDVEQTKDSHISKGWWFLPQTKSESDSEAKEIQTKTSSTGFSGFGGASHTSQRDAKLGVVETVDEGYSSTGSHADSQSLWSNLVWWRGNSQDSCEADTEASDFEQIKTDVLQPQASTVVRKSRRQSRSSSKDLIDVTTPKKSKRKSTRNRRDRSDNFGFVLEEGFEREARVDDVDSAAAFGAGAGSAGVMRRKMKIASALSSDSEDEESVGVYQQQTSKKSGPSPFLAIWEFLLMAVYLLFVGIPYGIYTAVLRSTHWGYHNVILPVSGSLVQLLHRSLLTAAYCTQSVCTCCSTLLKRSSSMFISSSRTNMSNGSHDRLPQSNVKSGLINGADLATETHSGSTGSSFFLLGSGMYHSIHTKVCRIAAGVLVWDTWLLYRSRRSRGCCCCLLPLLLLLPLFLTGGYLVTDAPVGTVPVKPVIIAGSSDSVVTKQLQLQLEHLQKSYEAGLQALNVKLAAENEHSQALEAKLIILESNMHSPNSPGSPNQAAPPGDEAVRAAGMTKCGGLAAQLTAIKDEVTTTGQEHGALLLRLRDCCRTDAAIAALVAAAVDKQLSAVMEGGGSDADSGGAGFAAWLSAQYLKPEALDARLQPLAERLTLLMMAQSESMGVVKEQQQEWQKKAAVQSEAAIAAAVAATVEILRAEWEQQRQETVDASVAAAAAASVSVGCDTEKVLAAGATSDSSSTFHAGYTSGMTKEEVHNMINQALLIYSADKTGQTDYALESAGGSVLSIRCSETFAHKTAQMSIFGIPLWYTSNSPRTVIQPDMYPGQCWAFKGDQGHLVLQLSTRITISAFSVEHIPKSLSPTGNINSAPKDFSIFGLEHERDFNGIFIGNYTYSDEGEPLQYFPVMNPDVTYQVLEIHFLSNHGHAAYTCVYRIRVHGRPSD